MTAKRRLVAISPLEQHESIMFSRLDFRSSSSESIPFLSPFCKKPKHSQPRIFCRGALKQGFSAVRPMHRPMRPSCHARRTYIAILGSACSALLALISLAAQSSSAASLSTTNHVRPAISLRMSLRGGGGGQSTLAPKYSSNTKLKMEEV
jgi:hypothetical protein